MDLFEKEYHERVSDHVIPGGVYFTNQKGKHLRPLLFFLAQGLIGKPAAESVPVSVLIELMHAASLLHDDVVDGSNLRRGRRSYPVLHGNRTSVLAGDYLVAKALTIAAGASPSGVTRVAAETLVRMTRGELMQNHYAGSPGLTLDAYYGIIQEKSASLFTAACDLAALVQKARPRERERLHRLGNAFGMAFQIRDDILDFTGKPGRLGKPTGLDVRNGHRTLPFLLALETLPPSQRRAWKQESFRSMEEWTKRVIRFVRERGGIVFAGAEADAWTQAALDFLPYFPPNPYRHSLEKLIIQTAQRVA
jgi:octaprenyl-diphosphate synthase